MSKQFTSQQLTHNLAIVIITCIATCVSFPATAQTQMASENSQETSTEITPTELTSGRNLPDTATHLELMMAEIETDTLELQLAKEKNSNNNRVPMECRIFPNASMRQ